MITEELPNQPYHAKIIGQEVINEGRFLGKVYFAELLDRNPGVYEWEASGITLEDAKRNLLRLRGFSPETIPAAHPTLSVLFPHMFTTYSPGNPFSEEERETNFYVRDRARTQVRGAGIHGLGPKEIGHSKSIGCPLEYVLIVPEEAKLLHKLGDVPKWMQEFAVPIGTEYEVTNPNAINEFLKNPN